ncbi:MAG: Holliday junction branch migration DNA helicase RuvB [Dehalococcoidia bacterium]|nr:MAG: Holliday junction branch migration DNA helicase RuvB [Chloroflexota bacterium]|tara:strand:+ start:14514 stop:15533 length:1020 start_codon:yes stop_codon:yes gene_type:complete
MTKDDSNKEIIFSDNIPETNFEPSEKLEFNFLRPKSFSDYIGQNKIIESLSIAVEASRKRDESLDHVLFYGPPGLGKTTLSYIISNQIESNFIHTSGPALEKPADAVGLLSNLSSKDVLFIDEIHRIPKTVEEYLYSAMEDFRVDFITGSGAFAKTINLRLESFTLVGSTTRPGLLSSPLRDRFGLSYHLDYYDENDLKDIILRSSRLLDLKIDENSSIEIAKRSRGTPRIANRLLRRVRDYVEVKNIKKINTKVINDSLEIEGVDNLGLDRLDREYLRIIAANYEGGPVGIDAISASLNEDQATLSDVVEPFLLKIGFIIRTSQGRKITKLAYKHLGI